MLEVMVFKALTFSPAVSHLSEPVSDDTDLLTLSQIQSYFTGRCCAGRLGQRSSSAIGLSRSEGVPWGSVLQPFLYSSPVSVITQSYGVRQQQFADTAVHVALTASDLTDELSAVKTWLVSSQAWFYTSGIRALNPNKFHVILLDSRHSTDSTVLSSGLISVDVAGSAVYLTVYIKLIGVIFLSVCTLYQDQPSPSIRPAKTLDPPRKHLRTNLLQSAFNNIQRLRSASTQTRRHHSPGSLVL